jgi:hypothetical protein
MLIGLRAGTWRIKFNILAAKSSPRMLNFVRQVPSRSIFRMAGAEKHQAPGELIGHFLVL